MARRAIWLLGVFAIAAAGHCAQASAAPTEYTIDPARTTVSFEVKRMGFSRSSGEFRSVAGTVAFDAATSSGSIELAVDTRSVRAGSETEEKFLRGPSVLDVEQHTEIAYKAEHVVFADGKPERIDGELTLLGVTRPVSLTVTGYTCPAQAATGQPKCVLEATAVFKRSEFGMTSYRAIVSDDVKLSIHGVAGHSEQR
jgi:polyisoprenoid-binding protein YceI